jgi:signal transduction histidine kinase
MYAIRQGAAHRFINGYLVATVITIIATFAFLYYSIVPSIEREVVARINRDLQDIRRRFQNEGVAGAALQIRSFLHNPGNADAVYLLQHPDGTKIAGNATLWPGGLRLGQDWQLVSIKHFPDPDPTLTGMRGVELEGGYRLLVGRDARALEAFRSSVMQALFAALLLTVLIAVGGGLLLSRFLLYRVKSIAVIADNIMQGDLSHRIQRSEDLDEFDQLAKSLNAMLSHIETLMMTTRAITDGIAHDFRSPLTRLKTRLEVVLHRKHTTETELRVSMTDALAEIDVLLTTLNALMEIVRAEGKLSREQMTTVNLSTLARDIGELYQPAAEDKGLGLVLNIDEQLKVHGHPTLLAQAVSNLLDNAIKYSPPGETITITAAPGADGPFIAVADHGSGIPEDKRSEVIKRFVRLDNVRAAPGVGLGLSLVAAVARQHDATLTLSDNQPGLRAVLRFLVKPARSRF